ncbi:putative LPXTG-motif cell wall anchor domain protein [Microbacterium sp. C448]|uniref:hypothetical protein n=1 Tax=Microbacterium sp. C448 TaxID=1177594 RepID=UPI0003DE24DE|nr:hypothetical protein [Microbacterium sp. C448]CDJ99620.1 putative LPXTG-motif cell wall anchor domain protein [Microbacterium sp. C448]
MRLPFPKATATAVLVAAFALAAPVAASATPAPSYPPSGSTSGDIAASSTTVAPGGTVSIAFPGDPFAPGETVTLSLTGENASGASLALVVKTVVQTKTLGTVAATSSGSAPAFTVRMPSNAVGNYVFTATSPSVPGGISVTVAAAGAAAGDEIANTGTDGAMLLGLWVGGGALLLAGGAVVVATTVRRQRQKVDA